MNATVQKSTPISQNDANHQKEKEPIHIGTLFSYATLSRFLRLIGASLSIAAIYLFLFQGWQTGNDIDRYSIMLMQILALSFAGFA